MKLERRISTLEKSSPKHDPLSVLSDEELNNELFKVCQRLHAAGLPIERATFIRCPECRQYSDAPVWAQDRTHRLDVFLEFKRIVFENKMPNQSRIISILNQGWSDQRISTQDQDWLLSAFHGTDLGGEGPWLKEYLDYSGSGSGSV